MPLWALWRRNWAVWMMPVTGLVVATWNNIQLPFFDHYPYWVAAQKTEALIILGMVACLAGAAEGAWQRRGKLNGQPALRSFLVRFGLPVVMTWLPTALLLMIGVTAVGGITAWQLWVTSLVSLFAWTCLGMALGVSLRPVIALPASVLTAFGWFAFTPAIEPPWPRHLSGTWSGCCTTSDVPNVSVMEGVLLVAVGLCFTSAGLLWIWMRNRKPLSGWTAVMVIPLAVGFAAAGALTHDIGYTPTQPRSDQVVCWPGSPEICMWPERRAYGGSDARDLRTIIDHWSKLGIHIPQRLSEATAELHGDTAPLIYNHSDAPEERVGNLALGIVTSCDGRNVSERTNGLDYFTAQHWLVLNSGLPDAGRDNTDDLKPFIDKPMAEQIKAFNGALAAWVCR